MQLNRNRIKELDYMRVFGMLLVVLGHSAYTQMITKHGSFLFEAEYGHIQSFILLFVRLIYSFHMPMFFFISGFLFQFEKKNNKWVCFKKLLKYKSIKLLFPMVLAAFFYSLPIKYVCGYFSNSNNLIYDLLVGQMVLFDNNYLWFLLSLFWCFVISWYLDAIIHKKTIFRIIFSLLLVIFGIILPYDFLGIQRCLLNYLWFEIGGYVYGNKEAIDNALTHSIAFSLLFCCTIVIYLCYLICFKNNPFVYRFIPLCMIALVYFFSHKFSLLITRRIRVFDYLNRKSFSIYIFSDPVNYLILFIIKKLNVLFLYKQNWFCFFIFLFRFVISIVISIIIDEIVCELYRRLRNEKICS